MFQVSTDIGEVRQALQAYHRILDLQNRFMDVEVYMSLDYCVPTYTILCVSLDIEVFGDCCCGWEK